MSHRRRRHLLVVAAALLAVAVGLLAALDTLPSWTTERGDEISAIHANDQATVAAPDRRIIRTHAATPIDTPLGIAVGAVIGLSALLALVTGAVRPLPARGPDRWQRHLGWILRSPPAPALAFIPVR